MYPKLSSKSIILFKYDHLESDKIFLVFTENFGIIYARAVSLRKPKSKLAPFLQNYLKLNLTFIRGKSGWKITEAREPSFSFAELNFANSRTWGALVFFLLKLTPKNEKSKELFSLLERFLEKLAKGQIKEFELLKYKYLILQELGYAPKTNPQNQTISNLKKEIKKALLDAGIYHPDLL